MLFRRRRQHSAICRYSDFSGFVLSGWRYYCYFRHKNASFQSNHTIKYEKMESPESLKFVLGICAVHPAVCLSCGNTQTGRCHTDNTPEKSPENKSNHFISSSSLAEAYFRNTSVRHFCFNCSFCAAVSIIILVLINFSMMYHTYSACPYCFTFIHPQCC